MQTFRKIAIGFSIVATGLLSVNQPANAITYDFSLNDGGFVSSGSPNWTYTGSAWETNNDLNSTQNFLTSPELTAASDGAISISFDHNYLMEQTYDGGVVEYSINGGSFTDFNLSQYDAIISSSFSSPIAGRSAFTSNTRVTETVTGSAGSLTAGDTYQIRFHAGWDDSVLRDDPAWQISSVELSNATTSAAVPFEFSPTLGLLTVGGIFGAARFRKKLAVSKALKDVTV